MRHFVCRLAACAAGAFSYSAIAQEKPADTLPLWELGGGVAGAWLPDYRGSDEARGYVLPFPYFVYRGEFLRADREGVRAKFFEFERVELDVSLGGTVPVNSTSNRARAGMPDLRPTLEVGPVLIVHLARDADGINKLDFRAPIRRAITWKDGSLRDVGTLFFPNINLDRRVFMGGQRWNFGVVAGAYFGDRRYHDYFYGVAPEFATSTRPAYVARSGFAGWQGIVALSARIGRAWVGGFAKGDSLRGAVFEDSPLVRKRENFSAGLGVSYVFAESRERVPASR
ncbi:MAG TPA: MipA/OmpV family protein [Burkholderiaceae bacterium]|nr:MipA/OmpV family protein [Burkholderiaceae bacterium]